MKSLGLTELRFGFVVTSPRANGDNLKQIKTPKMAFYWSTDFNTN